MKMGQPGSIAKGMGGPPGHDPWNDDEQVD